MGLHPFGEAHLDVDGVALNLGFHGVNLKKQVAVVHVQRLHVLARGVVVQALVQRFLAVRCPALHAQNAPQHLVGVQVVAVPGDVAEVVATAFVELHAQGQALGIAFHGVAHNHGIAVTFAVVKLQQLLLVVVVFGLLKLGGRQNFPGLALFGLFELAFQFAVAKRLVAFKHDVVNADFLAPLHVDAQGHAVGKGRIGNGYNHDFRVQKALVHKILAYLGAGIVQQRIGHDLAPDEGDFLGQLLGLALTDAGEGELREPGPLLEVEVQKYLVALDAGRTHAHVAQNALRPELAHGLANFLAGHVDGVAHPQAREADEGVGVEVASPAHHDAPQLIFVGLIGSSGGAAAALRPAGLRPQSQGKNGHQHGQPTHKGCFHGINLLR